MDFKLKGKTWVGNIYQKFEAICQEVDDIVRQDKVKSIVSHVQKVGKSVKKLNSDALENLCPSENPVNLEAKAVTDTFIESIISGQENTINNDIKLSNVELSFQGIANVPVTVPSLNSIDQKEYDFPFGKEGKSSTYDNSVEEIRKFSNVEKSALEDPQLIPLVDKVSREGLLHLELLNENRERELMNITEAPSARPPQIEDEIPNDIVDGLELDPDYVCDSPSSGWEPLIIICENENSEMECSSPVRSRSTESPLEDPQLIPFVDRMAHGGLLRSELSNENCESELRNMTEASSARPPQNEIPNDIVGGLELDPDSYCDLPPSGWEPIIIICENENSEVGCSSPVRSPSTESQLEDALIPFVDKMAHEGLLHLKIANENCESELRSMTGVSSARSPRIEDEIPNDNVDGLELDPDSFCDSPPSGWEPLLIICENENSEMGCSSPVHSPSTESCQESATFLSELPQILSCENEVSDLRVCSSVLSMESNGVDSSSISDALAQSWLSGNTFVSSSQTGFTGRWDDYGDYNDDPCLETIELGDEVQLGESCVIVDSDMLHAFSRRAGKHRSYKKLIQDALSSKRRITKEYEQLAIWHGDVDIDMRSRQHSSLNILPSSDLKKVTGKDSGDSEWEIL